MSIGLTIFLIYIVVAALLMLCIIFSDCPDELDLYFFVLIWPITIVIAICLYIVEIIRRTINKNWIKPYNF